jgi:hypothetical protein
MANNSTASIGNIRKKFHEIHELISTSYHEAGHTVYGLLSLMKIESVCVFADKKSKRIEGFTHYNSPRLDFIQDNTLFGNRLYCEIGLSYAGLIAEKRHFKLISGSDKFPMFLKEGSSLDIESAAQLFQKYNISEPGKKRYQFKKKIIKEVTQDLNDSWDDVALIAHALFKQKKLYFSDLKNLLTKKSKEKEFWKNQFRLIGFIYNKSQALDENDLKSILSL